MGLGDLFKHLLDDEPDAPAAPRPVAPLAPASAPPRPVGALLHREEMLDAHGHLSGYRFSFKVVDARVPVPPGAYLDALRAANVRAFAERRLAVVAVHLNEWLHEDFAALIGPHTVFQVHVPPALAASAEWLAGLRRMREAGAGVALSRVENTAAFVPALAVANFGFVDFSAYALEYFERTMKQLRAAHPALTLAVEQVHSWPERRLCMALGAAYVLGDFLSAPDAEEKGEKLNQSRLVLIEMLNLLRSDADTESIAHVAKRDPGVAVHILSMANSPVSGLLQPVASIEQAIVVLGREMLYRWLAVSVFRAGGGGARDEALLQIALARARFLELAALPVLPKADADALFLVGLLSFVDVLLGVPMADVVARMNLMPAVQDVLLRSVGPYGRYLMLAFAVEKGHADKAAQIAATLGIEVAALDVYRGVALLWAEEALRVS
ncbi:MAG: HDOD domain-containing protein [Rhodocyclaceae bacterium]|nr:HDOD domain-containing protein [Rhodocyclaceae bacterium]